MRNPLEKLSAAIPSRLALALVALGILPACEGEETPPEARVCSQAKFDEMRPELERSCPPSAPVCQLTCSFPDGEEVVECVRCVRCNVIISLHADLCTGADLLQNEGCEEQEQCAVVNGDFDCVPLADGECNSDDDCEAGELCAVQANIPSLQANEGARCTPKELCNNPFINN